MDHLIIYFSIPILIVQVIFFGYLFKFKKPHYEELKSFKKSISVIICGYNEAENINKFLPKFLTQDHPTFEIIFVNDRSSDNSSEILKKLESSFANLRVLEIHKTPDGWNSKKWALKQGVALAQFEFLLFTDADCYPASEHWISEMAKGLEHSKVVVGFGAYEKKQSLLNNLIQYETYMTAISMFGLAQKGINYMGIGRNFGIKKSIYNQFEWGINQNIEGGDDDLLISNLEEKIGIVVHPDGHTISIPKLNTTEYFRQKLRHINISKKYLLLHKSIIGSFNLSSLMFYLFVIYIMIFNEPLIGLSVIILRTSILFYNFVQSSKQNIIILKFHKIIFLDLCYVLLLWTLGPIALVAKRIKWK